MQKRNHFHRLQQKRYSRGVYHNPYFQAPKKNINHFIVSAATSCLLGIFVLIYLFSYPAFTLTSVEIVGLDQTSNTQMNEVIRTYLNQSHFFFFHNTNQFLFSEKKLKESLNKRFAFDQLSIKRKKQTLYLSVKERTSDIIWKTGPDAYLADLEGVITQKIDLQVAKKELPIMVDKNGKSVAIGDHVLTANQIKSMLAFEKAIIQQGIPISEIQIDTQVGKWIGLHTNQGYTVLFDPDQDAQIQSERFKTLLRETLKDTSHLQYVDLRFGDHVYYK